MPSLSLKASVNYPFIGGPSGPTYDPDASAWFSAVEATGSTITSTNKTAFNTAFLALKSNNIWDKISQGCFFVGIDGANPLAGAFIPFKNTSGATPQNVNFTTERYDKFTGIEQNGGVNLYGTMYINTNVQNRLDPYTDNPAFPPDNRHLLAYQTKNSFNNLVWNSSATRWEVDTAGANVQLFGDWYYAGDAPIGTSFGARVTGTYPQFNNWLFSNNDFGLFDVPTVRLVFQNTISTPPSGNPPNLQAGGGRGFFGMNFDVSNGTIDYILESKTPAKYYLNTSAPIGSEYSFYPADPATYSELPTNVIYIGGPLNTGNKRIACYSLGLGLDNSDQQGTLLTAYNTIINNLLSSLT
jgi:hypothetical protein